MTKLPFAAAALTLSVLIASCGQTGSVPSPTPTPEPDATVTANVITDRIQGWTPGTMGRLSVVEYPTTNPADAVVLSSAPVDAQGNFSLTLPTGAAVAPYMNSYLSTTPEGCTGFFNQSVPEATSYTVSAYTLEDRTNNTLVSRNFVQNNPGFNSYATAGDYFIERVYASTAHNVSGTLSCPNFKITLDLNLKAGWNATVLTYNTPYVEGSLYNVTITSPTTLPVSVF